MDSTRHNIDCQVGDSTDGLALTQLNEIRRMVPKASYSQLKDLMATIGEEFGKKKKKEKEAGVA